MEESVLGFGFISVIAKLGFLRLSYQLPAGGPAGTGSASSGGADPSRSFPGAPSPHRM